jgi:hypothetical protein
VSLSRSSFVSILLAAGVAAALLPASIARAQAAGSGSPIQDNSFLVEEAYNQERHVVQMIQTYQRVAGSSGYAYTLTQEWPVSDVKNQFSFSVPLQGVASSTGLAQGVGDAALNYRRQLVGDGTATVAFSPRLTLLVPTGNAGRALGTGSLGAQVNLPVSAVLSPRLVSHTNLGATHVFAAKGTDGARTPLTGWNAGQSLVWLAHQNLNLLLEGIVTRNEVLAEGGGTEQVTEAWVSPGIRFALNLPGRLQLVPGFAVPIGVGPSRGKTGLFLYFSVELPLLGGEDH